MKDTVEQCQCTIKLRLLSEIEKCYVVRYRVGEGAIAKIELGSLRIAPGITMSLDDEVPVVYKLTVWCQCADYCYELLTI